MSKAIIVIGKNIAPELVLLRSQDADVFGADQGAAYCLKHGIPMNVAVGDFDSVSEQERAAIESSGAKIVVLPHHKDMTDTSYAVDLCQSYDEVRILGGIEGDRIEHLFANVDLLRARPNTLFLEDDNACCVVLRDTEITLWKADYEYVSVFALTDACVTLVGFEYPLNEYLLRAGDPLGVSNEIVDEEATIRVKSGLLLFIGHKRSSSPS